MTHKQTANTCAVTGLLLAMGAGVATYSDEMMLALLLLAISAFAGRRTVEHFQKDVAQYTRSVLDRRAAR